MLQDPEAIFQFQEHTITIPIGVIEELDTFKKDQGELGKNARQVSRYLDELRVTGDLREGVPVGKGKLSVRYNGNLKSYYKERHVDLHVLEIATFVENDCKDKNIDCEIIIVSNDINVRIRANALGIKSEPYYNKTIKTIYKGHSEAFLSHDDINFLAEHGRLDIDALSSYEGDIHPNHYLLINSLDEENHSILAKISRSKKEMIKLSNHLSASGISPQNKEQVFAMDALLDPDIKMLSLSGRAGCGKTLLACAAGYQQVIKHRYKRLLVSRPVMPMGKDLGALPGEINEKLDPWMQPIYDAFEVINDDRDGKNFVVKSFDIKVEPLTYIRGRSIRNQFMVIDESQNLSRLEAKTIITRAGDQTKVVFTGDIDQIDNPYINKFSNGLSITMDAFADSTLSATVMMEKGVRSDLSEEASKRL